jgi:very-short-patch-repair endonuclease
MRFRPTRGEEWLWRCLSGSKTGFAFRRQLVIGNHIVDFACTKVRLAVEVDGASHHGREQRDSVRDCMLAGLGWYVLRVTEEEVVTDTPGVVRRIVIAAGELPPFGG